MSLKTRLAIMSAISLLATITLAVVVAFQLDQLVSRFESFRTTSVIAEKYTLMINRDLNYSSRLTRSIMLGDNFDKNYSKLDRRIADIRGHFEALEAAIGQMPGGGQALRQAVSSSMTDSMRFLEDGRSRMLALKAQHGNAQARADAWQAYKREASPVANSARTSFRALQELLSESINRNTHKMEAAIADAHTLSWVIGGVVMLVVALSAATAMLIRSCMLRLDTLRQTMATIGDTSDLTRRVEVQGEDELAQTGRIFNSMLDRFQQLIQQMVDSSSKVAAASTQLDGVARSGIRDQETQSDAIATVVSAMSQMEGSVSEVSRDAQQAADAATEARGHSHQGIELAREAVQTMQTLASKTGDASGVVSEVHDASGRINTVLGVIQAVSEQTNLLALNAAIEAARAGDQGRGFAVVADEVRTLAIRSQESTQEIQRIIDALQQSSDQAVQAMEANQQLADDSVTKSQEMCDTLDQVVAAIDTIQQMNTHIAASATEQSSVATDINGNVTRLQELGDNSQQSAREVEQSSHSLAGLAGDLQTVVGQFRYQG